MTRISRGGLFALLLFFPTFSIAEVLTATRETGEEIARMSIPRGGTWCVIWNHSVDGFEVKDCYANLDGQMVLVWSHLPDFAAGLDHIPGRGRQVSDGQGGYFILDIYEPVEGNAYVLRPGAGRVDHRLRAQDEEVSLSAVAPRERVTIALIGEETDD